MADAAEVQVSHFLDEYGLGSFQIKLIIWSVLIAIIDGYDIGAIAFAAPHLIRDWHIAPKDLGLAISACCSALRSSAGSVIVTAARHR